MAYWLFKSEPGAWSWDDQVRDGTTFWNGVRNHQANNNMKAMKIGDQGFFYHSVNEKQVVGIVEVTREHYPDHTDDSGRFGMVDITAVQPVASPVTLADIKANPKLADMVLVKNSRLSVQPVTAAEWQEVCRMAGGNGVGWAQRPNNRHISLTLSHRERVASESEPGEGLQTMTRSRQLRRNATDAEKLLWKHLRNRQLAGAKFRRQVSVDRYTVDFLCERARVIIELVGSQHAQQIVYDCARTAALEAYGYIVLRYWNSDVLMNIEGVLQEIEDVIRRSGNPSIP